ncbi:MAG TPA: hypothetical protein VGY77_04830 [Gemmataceae bacterium]|nr:hypothetical protein [Gemmataceae bacterium]
MFPWQERPLAVKTRNRKDQRNRVIGRMVGNRRTRVRRHEKWTQQNH